jgi:hypothetical protein
VDQSNRKSENIKHEKNSLKIGLLAAKTFFCGFCGILDFDAILDFAAVKFMWLKMFFLPILNIFLTKSGVPVDFYASI